MDITLSANYVTCFEILQSNLGALLTKLNEIYTFGIKNTQEPLVAKWPKIQVTAYQLWTLVSYKEGTCTCLCIIL